MDDDEYEVNESRLTAILAGLGSLPAGSRHILVRELIERCEPAAALDALIIAAKHPNMDDINFDWITADSSSPVSLATTATRHLTDDALATLIMLLEDSCGGEDAGIADAWWTAQTEAEVWQEVDAWPELGVS